MAARYGYVKFPPSEAVTEPGYWPGGRSQGTLNYGRCCVLCYNAYYNAWYHPTVILCCHIFLSDHNYIGHTDRCS
jgi:hypothetical protein